MPIGEPLAASSSVVVFRLPDGISPGEHTITARPDAGFETPIDVEIVALRLSGSIDQELLMQGQSTPMQIWIEGSDEPLELLLRNKTPEIVSIGGGEVGVVALGDGFSTQFLASRQAYASIDCRTEKHLSKTMEGKAFPTELELRVLSEFLEESVKPFITYWSVPV